MSDRDRIIAGIVIGSIILWVVVLSVDPNFFMRFKMENLDKGLKNLQLPFNPASLSQTQTPVPQPPKSTWPRVVTIPSKFTTELGGEVSKVDDNQVLNIYVWNYGGQKQKFYFSKLWSGDCLIYKAPPIFFSLNPNEKARIRYPLKCNIQNKIYLKIYTFDQKEYEIVEVNLT